MFDDVAELCSVLREPTINEFFTTVEINEIAEKASDEIIRLRRENEGLQRILTDMQLDSTAYLRGLEQGTLVATRLPATVRSSVVMRANGLEVDVRHLKITTDEAGEIHVEIDGRPADGFRIQLQCWKSPVGMLWSEVVDQENTIAELRKKLAAVVSAVSTPQDDSHG